jgi:hypothetical protein
MYNENSLLLQSRAKDFRKDHSMLKFEGHQAAVILAAKNGFENIPGSHLHSLQSAFAVLAGLPNATDVRMGDVISIVSQVHDLLTQHGLIRKPMESMFDSLKSALMFRRNEPPDTPTFFLNAMISNITCTRIRSEAGEELFNWRDGLEPDFAQSVLKMYEKSFPQPTLTPA